MTNESIVKFHVANKAATHLGRKLYSTTPPALAELIANSYDAYAKEVVVLLDNSDSIVVADNGNGMSFATLNNQYAVVGSEKIPDQPPKDMASRKPMGKKGIGKLASFSLGDTYTIYTRVNGESQWRKLTLNYQEYTSSINQLEYEVDCHVVSLPEDLTQFEEYASGTIVKITSLRRKVTKSTHNAFKEQLSRRFYIRKNSDVFNIILNGEDLDLSINPYYKYLDYASYIGFNEQEASELLNTEGNHCIELDAFDLSRIQDANQKQDMQTLIDSDRLKGWIGTVSKPKELKADQSNNANVVVYINGKIADEDVLKEHPNATMANEYIVGEFFADYLGEKEEDPITSSRQGLDNSDEQVARLIKTITFIRDRVADEWGNRRENSIQKKMPSWFGESDKYASWKSTLTSDQMKLNNKLMKAVSYQIDRDEIDDGRVCALVNCIINVVENEGIYGLAGNLEKLGLDSEAQYSAIAELLTTIAQSEDLKQAQIVSERLEAIQQLEKIMQDTSMLEKAFENHLFENPWLINPYWNKTGKAQSEIEIVRQKFHRLYDNQTDEYKKTFIDIYVEVAEEKYPIIVELKKNTPTGHGNVNREDITSQITKYRDAISEALGVNGPGSQPSKINAYFILSEDCGNPGQANKIVFNDDDYNVFKALNITILPYNIMLQQAKQAYRSHLKVLEETVSVPFFSIA